MRRIIAIVVSLLLVSSCSDSKPPRSGGDQERALATAVLAGDAAAVTTLLASHADPSLMVDLNSRSQSAWYIALDQLRPDRPASVAIITAMLKAGADPNVAWGTGGGNVTRLPVPRWRQFMSGGRVAGTGPSNPMALVMQHPVAAAVRALVDARIDPRLGQNALVNAIETGDAEIVHILVDAGVDVNCRPGANTPLVAAIETRSVPLMTYLEAHGAREKP